MANDLSRNEERRGTRKIVLWAAVIAAVIFVLLLLWPLLPGSENGDPNGSAPSFSDRDNSSAQ